MAKFVNVHVEPAKSCFKSNLATLLTMQRVKFDLFDGAILEY
jgi:hypothetical protein